MKKGVSDMFLNILKKDLKRKGVMNIILLIFIILATAFISSSINNIVSVTGGLDYFFEKAGVTDHIVQVPSVEVVEEVVLENL